MNKIIILIIISLTIQASETNAKISLHGLYLVGQYFSKIYVKTYPKDSNDKDALNFSIINQTGVAVEKKPVKDTIIDYALIEKYRDCFLVVDRPKGTMTLEIVAQFIPPPITFINGRIGKNYFNKIKSELRRMVKNMNDNGIKSPDVIHFDLTIPNTNRFQVVLMEGKNREIVNVENGIFPYDVVVKELNNDNGIEMELNIPDIQIK